MWQSLGGTSLLHLDEPPLCSDNSASYSLQGWKKESVSERKNVCVCVCVCVCVSSVEWCYVAILNVAC